MNMMFLLTILTKNNEESISLCTLCHHDGRLQHRRTGTGQAEQETTHWSRGTGLGKQARHIAYELAFDDATTQKFVATYQDYQKEVWAPRTTPRSMTD